MASRLYYMLNKYKAYILVGTGVASLAIYELGNHQVC